MLPNLTVLLSQSFFSNVRFWGPFPGKESMEFHMISWLEKPLYIYIHRNDCWVITWKTPRFINLLLCLIIVYDLFLIVYYCLLFLIHHNCLLLSPHDRQNFTISSTIFIIIGPQIMYMSPKKTLVPSSSSASASESASASAPTPASSSSSSTSSTSTSTSTSTSSTSFSLSFFLFFFFLLLLLLLPSGYLT